MSTDHFDLVLAAIKGATRQGVELVDPGQVGRNEFMLLWVLNGKVAGYHGSFPWHGSARQPAGLSETVRPQPNELLQAMLDDEPDMIPLGVLLHGGVWIPAKRKEVTTTTWTLPEPLRVIDMVTPD